MTKENLLYLPINLTVSLILSIALFWIFYPITNSQQLLRTLSYLFGIGLAINFVISVISLLIKLNINTPKALHFVGNIVFLFLPSLLNLETIYIIKILFVLLFMLIIFLSSTNLFLVIQNNSKTENKENQKNILSTLKSIILSRIFTMVILSLAGSIIFFESRFMILTLIILAITITLEDIKRLIATKKFYLSDKYDIVLESFRKAIEPLNSEIEKSTNMMNVMKLQIEIFSNSKKEIFSGIEAIKQKISENVEIIEKYEIRYSTLENDMNEIISNYSTYVLGFEYYLSKIRENIDKVNKVFQNSYDTISSGFLKKDEIAKIFSDNNPILESLLSKTESTSELLTNIILEENKMTKNMELILLELNALSVISTNVQIESFKSKSGRTMETIVSEIGEINSKIRNYITEIQEAFNKFLDLFDYINSTSKSLLKHSERIKYHIGLIGTNTDNLISTFYTQVSNLSSLNDNINQIYELLSSLSNQVKHFREFLEKLSTATSLVSEIREKLIEMKSSLNDTIIVLEEIQQNVSES